MAIYFENPDQDPAVHILMIGVSSYPFLTGGANERQQLGEILSQLGQISSPAVSVAALFQTVMDLHHSGSWIRSLGSVEVLLSSDNPPAIFGANIEAATRLNIRDAYRRWRTRCESHPENVALFFFSGHGLDDGEPFILPADFGEDPDDVWRNAIAARKTREAFSSCIAETQIFLIDSCRQCDANMLETAIPINPLETAQRITADSKYSLLQHAAAPTEAAFGIVDAPSFYTQALISALKGNAAENKDSDHWTVSTGALSSKMNEFMGNIAEEQGYPQRCISHSSDVTDIIRLPGPPQVQFTVTCDPELALAQAELSCENVNTNDRRDRPPMEGSWSFNVEAGVYRVAATFQPGTYTSRPKIRPVSPPWTREEIKCN